MNANFNDDELDDNEALLEQAKRIRALHAIISRPDLSFDQQIDEALRLGCRLLGTEIGKIGRQNPEKNTSEFLNTVVLSDLPAKRGVILPLDKTYCNITFSSPETIAISDVSNSKYNTHPALAFTGIHSYIGCTINIHGKKFGTINFSNRAPIGRQFTKADRDLVNLIGSWISIMMERQLEADQLKAAKEEADRANQAKSVFLAHMSHEIRTPLTAIIGFTDFALHDDQSAEQKKHSLEIVRNSSNHLLSLINDVLDFSKIEAGELDTEQRVVKVSELMNSVETITSGQATRKGLQFGVDYIYPIPITIHSDMLRLKQILLNLCSNAIKFTDAGSVRLRVSYDVPSKILRIAVIDTGIGLDTENIDKVFQPFKQVDVSTTRKYGGTGLGLPLSRRIAELLGGALTVKSEINVGSTFELALQLADESPQGMSLAYSHKDLNSENEGNANRLSAPQVTGTILVVDDNDVNQLLLRKYLEKTGAVLTFAGNGAAAVSLAKKHTYDLILMDMQMPILSGIDALHALRGMNYSGPVAMLTANATLDDRTACEKAGCNDFLTKPIVKEKLYQAVAKYLSH